MQIVETIAALCKNAGTSLNALEKELGFGKGTIYRWNEKVPGVDKVRRVADYFGVSVDYILGREPADETQELLREKYDMPDGIDIDTAIEAMHKNPKLKVLFSRSAKMDDADLDFMLQLIDRINKENEDGL